ncbi:MAG: SH3 domain-containing protein, partial [Chloroflexota bacterium]
MQRRFFTVFCLAITFVVLAFSIQTGFTQGASSDCPQLVQQALTDVGNSCGGLGRNSACYGFNRVNATFSADVSDDLFSKPADKTALKDLQSIQTAALDEQLKVWGVAVMSVQANIPDTLPGQAVSFILLGDVKVDNAVAADQAVAPANPPLDVTTVSQSNIRTLPTTNSNVIGSVEPGNALKADAINPTKDWLRVVFKDTAPGWISRTLVKDDSSLDNLPLFSNDSKTPMQAFYFKTGVGAPSCNSAPDALVVQGPDHVGVDITANGANVHIGSTVAFRTIEGNQMQIFTLHGQAKVNGITIPIGFVTTVKLSDDGKTVVGEPGKPRPITQDELNQLQWLELIPDDVLNYPITVQDHMYVPPPTAVPNTITGGGDAHPVTAVNCGPFKATSPLDGLNFGMNSFYWDAAPGATSYRVNVQGAGSKETTAPTTNANFDISGAGFNPTLSWSVDALFNGVVVCSTSTITIPRQWAPPPPPPPPPGLAASW